LAKVKNFKDEKETIAIAKTPGHRKKPSGFFERNHICPTITVVSGNSVRVYS